MLSKEIHRFIKNEGSAVGQLYSDDFWPNISYLYGASQNNMIVNILRVYSENNCGLPSTSEMNFQ